MPVIVVVPSCVKRCRVKIEVVGNVRTQFFHASDHVPCHRGCRSQQAVVGKLEGRGMSLWHDPRFKGEASDTWTERDHVVCAQHDALLRLGFGNQILVPVSLVSCVVPYGMR